MKTKLSILIFLTFLFSNNLLSICYQDDTEKRTPIQIAMQSNNINGLIKLIHTIDDLDHAFLCLNETSPNFELQCDLLLNMCINKFLDNKAMLCWASKLGRIECVRNLIKENIMLNTQNAGSYTALMLAAQRDHYEIVWLLLINGADTSIINKHGYSFFDIAKDKPGMLAVIERYKEFVKQRRQIIFDTISKKEGFNQDMPDDLVDLINNCF